MAIKDFIVNDKSPRFYQYYPRLFQNYFKVDDKIVKQLSEAGYLYYHSILKLIC